jgi:hypothetical protein
MTNELPPVFSGGGSYTTICSGGKTRPKKSLSSGFLPL